MSEEWGANLRKHGARIRLETLIILSHTLPIWEELGGLNSHVHPSSLRYFEMLLSSCWRISRSLQAPLKLVPQSKRIIVTGQHIAKKCCRALMKLDVSINSISSICAARTRRHVKSTAHLLLFAAPPLVWQVEMFQGPNTSRPTFVKGDSVLRRSGGRSAIFCSAVLPRSLLHVTHLRR